MSKLKPVTFVQGKYNYNNQNTGQQILLLKALKITQDPEKLRQMIGAKTVADVFRTFDKISIRKDYHGALNRAGISFDFIVNNIKKIVEDDEAKDSDKLGALKTLMRSVGMDKYEDSTTGGGSWEDIIAALPAGNASPKVMEKTNELYEVRQPIMPESAKKKKIDDGKYGNIYG